MGWILGIYLFFVPLCFSVFVLVVVQCSLKDATMTVELICLMNVAADLYCILFGDLRFWEGKGLGL